MGSLQQCENTTKRSQKLFYRESSMAYPGIGEDEANTCPLLRPLDCDMTFASRSLTLGQFSGDFSNLLPLLIHIKEGYDSLNEKDFTLSSGEIYRITHILKQKRVVVKDSSGQLLSFPVDHCLKFLVSQKGQTSKVPVQAQTLEKILESVYYKDNPKFTFISPVRGLEQDNEELVFWNGADEEISMEMDNLQIVDKYDERYLVGNGVLDEEVTLSPIIIPIWLPAKVEVIDGFKGEPRESFQEFIEHLDYVFKKAKNHTVPGNKEIMLFEEESGHAGPYTDIRQSHYVSIGQVKRETRHNYEPVQLKSQLDVISEGRIQGQSKRSSASLPAENSPSMRHSKSLVENSTLKDIMEKLKDRKFSLRKKPKAVTDTQDTTGKKRECYEKIVKTNELPQTYDKLYPEKPPDLPTRSKPTNTRSIRKPAPPHPDKSLSQTQDVIAADQKQGRIQMVQDTGGLRSPGEKQLMTSVWVQRNEGTVPRLPQARSHLHTDNKTTGRSREVYEEWDLPDRDKTKEPTYFTHKDVKVPVNKMSMKEVSATLMLLKLDKYTEQFKENDIDGAMLADLDEDILIKEFGMSSFEALKLIKFVQGWRLK